MISFMILGGPRSGTTWAANWLTTDTTICLHDPLLEFNLQQLSQLYYPGKRLGVADTCALLYPKWVKAQACPKIVLYRSVAEINVSLSRLGLIELGELKHLGRIDAVKGIPIFPYEQLFNPSSAQKICGHLGVPWDAARHDVLRQMRVEPLWKHLNVGAAAARELVQRITEAR